MNELQKTTKDTMLTPAETSRAVLFQEVANREINDTVAPDFFSVSLYGFCPYGNC